MPGVQHRDLVAEGQGLGLIVRDQDCRDARLREHAGNGFPRRFAQSGIECGERFIQQHQAGLAGERTRQGDALLLAARQFVRTAGQQNAIKFDHVHQRQDTVLPVHAVRQTEPDIVGNAQMRKQRAILRDKTDVPAMRWQESLLVRENGSFHCHAAGIRRLKTGDQAEQGGLAGARGSDDHGPASCRDVETEIVHGDHGSVTLAHRSKLKKAHRPAMRLDCAC